MQYDSLYLFNIEICIQLAMWNPNWNDISKTATEYASNLTEIVAPSNEDDDFEEESRQMDAMLKSLRNIVGETTSPVSNLDVTSKWESMVRLVALAEQKVEDSRNSDSSITESNPADKRRIASLESERDELMARIETLEIQISTQIDDDINTSTSTTHHDQLIHNYQAQVKTLKADARLCDLNRQKLETQVENLTKALKTLETSRSSEIKVIEKKARATEEALQEQIAVLNDTIAEKDLVIERQRLDVDESLKARLPTTDEDQSKEEIIKVIKQLVVTYIETTDKSVLQILANVLSLDTTEMDRIGLRQTPSIDDGQSFTDAWTQFLTSEIEK